MPKAKKKARRKKTPKRVPKKIQTISSKPPATCKCCCHGHPLSMVLYVIGIIVIIYGAWFRELLWLILGFVPIIIGLWWEHISRK